MFRQKLLAAVLTLTLVFGLALMAITDAFAQGQGRGKQGPEEIEVLKFVHYVNPESSGNGGPPIKNDQYRTMHGGKVKWYVDMPISAVIDDGFSDAQVTEIEKSLDAWDDVSGWDVLVAGGDVWGSVQDDENAISWNKEDLYPNIIGVTWIWYYPNTGEIVEVGTELNTDFDWSTTGETGKMDVQNIMTHEVGHWMVLEDLRQPTAREITMYAYSDYGETIKRDLQSGDVAGAQALYGVATAPPLIPAKKLSTTWGSIKSK